VTNNNSIRLNPFVFYLWIGGMEIILICENEEFLWDIVNTGRYRTGMYLDN